MQQCTVIVPYNYNIRNNSIKLFLKTKTKKTSPLNVPVGVAYYTTFFHKHLTECDVGLYGANCEGVCSPNCIKPGICDKVTGYCDGGCQDGWTQIKCDAGKTVFSN